jgi:pyridoxamine 5'-phosphate oxidase-like protein
MWVDRRGSEIVPRPECLRLLVMVAKDEGIGRLGLVLDEDPNQAPVVVPVNFRLHEGQLFLRLGEGIISGAADQHLVAFEVDRVDREAGQAWSVLARGFARLVRSPNKQPLEATAHPLVPEAGDMVLMLRPSLVTGRRFELH